MEYRRDREHEGRGGVERRGDDKTRKETARKRKMRKNKGIEILTNGMEG